MDVSKTMQTIIDVAYVVGFKVAGAIRLLLFGRGSCTRGAPVFFRAGSG